MASESHWPDPAEAPAMEDLSRCVHCGLCVNACPTYAITGLEVESPRGRIFLARAVAEGDLAITPTVQQHWDLCLQCRACEAVCPSGVPYGRIMEHTRAQLQADPPRGRIGRRLRRFLLRNVVARPGVLAAAVSPARWYANSRLRRTVRATGILRLSKRLRAMEAQLPGGQGKPFRVRPANTVANATFFVGCIMAELFGETHRATLRVLRRSGITCETPPGQGCCGALHAHDGDLAFARELARKNIEAFEGTPGPIVVNSAGCGAAMKEYGDLLAHDEAWAARAAAFSARVRDFSEVVDPVALAGARFEGRVAYQDACHLAHAQRIREQPRALLSAVGGCRMVETAGADMCCGAAGIYSLTQPAMSAALRTRKAEQFREHRPEVIVTANPGCQMQYNAAVVEAGIEARVLHLAEFLDEATANS